MQTTIPKLEACQMNYLVVHLFGAVEDIHHNSKGSTQVLGGLSFSSASWSRRGSTHGEMEGLGQGDVTSGGAKSCKFQTLEVFHRIVPMVCAKSKL